MNKTFEHGRALIVGIGPGYPGNLKLPALIRADAEGLAKVLRDPAFCGYPAANVEILLDEQATKANILNGLRTLGASAKEDDTAIIYFSGHGAQRFMAPDVGVYLCPVDFESARPKDTGIEASELSSLMSAIPAARVVVILDACHSEGAAHLKDADAQKGLGFGFRGLGLEKLVAGAGRIVISSCKDEETSVTCSAKGFSLFTYYFLEGLKGSAVDRGDGLVHVLDLFHYVSEEVPRNAPRGHQQHPVLKAHAETNFSLALRKGGWFKSAVVTGALASSDTPVDLPGFELVLTQLYPTGPAHDQVWSRAGGDMASLSLGGSGRAAWHSAMKMLLMGGGGTNITVASLLATALADFPNSVDLIALSEQNG